MHQDSPRASSDALRAHLPFLRRHACALTSDRELADALVRDCLGRAVSRVGRRPPEGDLRVWLFGLLHQEYDRRPRAPETGAAGVEPARIEPAPLRLFRSAFDRLAPGDRQVLLLTGLEGLSAAETAAVLGVDSVTVRLRAVRARKRLLAFQQQTGAPRGARMPCGPTAARRSGGLAVTAGRPGAHRPQG